LFGGEYTFDQTNWLCESRKLCSSQLVFRQPSTKALAVFYFKRAAPIGKIAREF